MWECEKEQRTEGIIGCAQRPRFLSLGLPTHFLSKYILGGFIKYLLAMNLISNLERTLN